VNRAIILMLAASLGGCASFVADYEERLVRSLPNQREVTISDTQTYPGKILCGEYTTLTGQGFTMRSSSFVVGSDFVLNNPSPDHLAVYCSKDPAGVLLERFGIGAADGDWSSLVRIRDDMLLIDAAIMRYYDQQHALPRSLDRLLDGDFGITEEAMIDPWGQTYGYRGGLSGRSVPQYTLVSRGADAAPGGEGTAADISRELLPLLDHVIRLGGY